MSFDSPPRETGSSAVLPDDDDDRDPRMPYLPSGLIVVGGKVVDTVEARYSDYHDNLSIFEASLSTKREQEGIPQSRADSTTTPSVPIDPAIMQKEDHAPEIGLRTGWRPRIKTKQLDTTDAGDDDSLPILDGHSILARKGSDATEVDEDWQLPPTTRAKPRPRPHAVANSSRRQTRAMARGVNAMPLLAGLDHRGRPLGQVITEGLSGTKDFLTEAADDGRPEDVPSIELRRASITIPSMTTNAMARAAISPRGSSLKRKRNGTESAAASPVNPSIVSTEEGSTIVVAGTNMGGDEWQERGSKRRKSHFEDFSNSRSWVEGEVRGHWCDGVANCRDCRESMSMEDGVFDVLAGIWEAPTDGESEDDLEFIDSP